MGDIKARSRFFEEGAIGYVRIITLSPRICQLPQLFPLQDRTSPRLPNEAFMNPLFPHKLPFWINIKFASSPKPKSKSIIPTSAPGSHSFSQISRAPNRPKRMAQTPEHPHAHPCTRCPGFSNWPHLSPKPSNHCEGTARAILNRHGLSAGPLDWQVQWE